MIAMSTQSGGGLLDKLIQIRFNDSRVIFVESVIVIILTWTLAAHIFNIVDVVSKPSLIGASMYEIARSERFLEHMIPTLRRTALGLWYTLIIGTVLGVAMGMRENIEKAFQDYITVGLAMPGLFIAIFAGMWFGTTDLTMIVAATVISFPFLTQNVYEGIRDIDNELLEMASAFDLSNRRGIRRIILPAVMPEWFSGTRYALAIVWKTVTLAELVAANNGIGFVIRAELEALDFTGAMAWTILFVLVVLVVEYGILQQIEKRVFSWRQSISGVIGA